MPPSPESLQSLPIDAARERIAAAVQTGRVVLSAPTGTGKSTRVPGFCAGTVLVVEPRRVACMTLAERVASELGAELGDEVGYWVRDDRRLGAGTRIVFATPGVTLRARELLDRDVVILDEFHERGLETDLLLALLQQRRQRGLMVMSATLETGRIADALAAERIEVQGRNHPVEIRHVPGEVLLPDPHGLEQRVVAAVDMAAGLPGDVLVFLPGKAEIGRVATALAGRGELEVVELHGSLSLQAQRRAFAPGKKRKVVLATNVAETSVTVPGVGVVIDSGLVRRTRYHYGRAYLTLTPIAMDSAEQRAGRAGRTGPGVCLRLWSASAQLEATTPPAIHREPLSPLLLAAAAAGARMEELPFLDPPTEHALNDARQELRALGAIDDGGGLTGGGRELFGLPLDPALGRILLEARQRGTLDDAIDLVAALSVGRPLFAPGARQDDRDEDLRERGCDATALIRAVRVGEPRRHGLSAGALHEARAAAKRLRQALGTQASTNAQREVDRSALAATILAADPRTAHVTRERKKRVAFSNGGTELELARESAVQRGRLPEAIAVLSVQALGDRRGGRLLLCTCAMPLSLSHLAEAGLGREQVGEVRLKRGVALATVERVYARRVLQTEERVPTGELARHAIAELLTRGRLLPDAVQDARAQLEATALAHRLKARGRLHGDAPLPAAGELQPWLLSRLSQLGVESGEDVALLSAADLQPEPLPYEVQTMLEREFPLRVDMGDAIYRVEYDLGKSRATLHLIKGNRQTPPTRAFLPKLGGLRVFVEAGGRMHLVR
ncbi:MAG: helicase-related protein [Myxococcales bacterium]|jgi:ATP-dependent helicase HrpB